MPKRSKPKNGTSRKNLLQTKQPWKCRHHKAYSEISTYAEANGNWEKVLTIHPSSAVSADTIAQFILGLLNNHQQNQNLLQAAMEALENVMKDGLNFTTEQSAEHVVTHIKKVMS